jgi:hypothetical protein
MADGRWRMADGEMADGTTHETAKETRTRNKNQKEKNQKEKKKKEKEKKRTKKDSQNDQTTERPNEPSTETLSPFSILSRPCSLPSLFPSFLSL